MRGSDNIIEILKELFEIVKFSVECAVIVLLILLVIAALMYVRR